MNLKNKLLAAGALIAATSSAFAVDVTGAITAAETSATANVTAAATAVIAVVAVMFGISLVIGVLRK